MNISKCLFCGKDLIITSTFHEAGRNRKAFTVKQSLCENCFDYKDCNIVFDEDGIIFLSYLKNELLYTLGIFEDNHCEFYISKYREDSTSNPCLDISYEIEYFIIDSLVSKQQLNPETYVKFIDKKLPLILTFQ